MQCIVSSLFYLILFTSSLNFWSVEGRKQYLPLGVLVADEGTAVGGPIINCGIECCRRRCDAEQQCNSFTQDSSSKICFLKDRCIKKEDFQGGKKSAYTSWWTSSCEISVEDTMPAPVAGRKKRDTVVEGGSIIDNSEDSSEIIADEKDDNMVPLDSTARALKAKRLDEIRKRDSQERELARQQLKMKKSENNNVLLREEELPETNPAKTASSAPARQNVLDILHDTHKYCISEMYTEKWNAKSGSNLGSVYLKKSMENPASTFCSNSDWLKSTIEHGYNPDNVERFNAIFPESSEPCEADQLFHYIGSGLGSWVSNIANLMYSMDNKKMTMGFRDQRARANGTTNANKRYEMLFGHRFPECTAKTDKTTRVMVMTNEAERLKNADICKYAAMKHFYSANLWNVIRSGILKDEVTKTVDFYLESARNEFVGVGTGSEAHGKDANVPFIGVHLRHKWEFRLTPPRIEDVARLLRSVVANLDPTQHTEISDAEPPSSGDRHALWGLKPVVFCASDDIASCRELQQLLAGDNFQMLFVDNSKVMSSRDGVINYLVDVALLEAAAVFIGQGSSNLSRWVNAIRGPKKLSLSLDVDWNAIHF